VQCDQPLEKRQFDALRVGLPGKLRYHFRLGYESRMPAPDLEKVDPAIMARGNVGAAITDRRYGSGNSIAPARCRAVKSRQREVSDAFFGADGDDRLRIGSNSTSKASCTSCRSRAGRGILSRPSNGGYRGAAPLNQLSTIMTRGLIGLPMLKSITSSPRLPHRLELPVILNT